MASEEELSVAECVADALGGQRIPVITGIASQRPARPVGGAEIVRQVAGAGQTRSPLASPQPLGQARHLRHRRPDVPLNIGADGPERGAGPLEEDADLAVVGREGQDARRGRE